MNIPPFTHSGAHDAEKDDTLTMDGLERFQRHFDDFFLFDLGTP